MTDDVLSQGASFSPWDRREFPSRFSVEDTVRRLGNYKWVEMKIFELLGGWVAFIPEAEIKVRLGHHCYHHAFHAELWHKRLPELRQTRPEDVTAPPNPEFAAFVDAIGDLEQPAETIEKLVGLYRVLLPHLIAAYTFHLNNTATITDAPTMRALELCLRDDMDEWRDGEMMLQALITTPAEARRAADRQAELSELLLASGGVTGADSIRFSAS